MKKTDDIKQLKYDFDDILIEPTIITNIKSRYSSIKLSNKLPLFTAPMDTVVDLSNYHEFLSKGINVVLPRTVNYQDYIDHYIDSDIKINEFSFSNLFFSFGFTDIEKFKKLNYKELHRNAHILIDVANGHMRKIVEYCHDIKKHRPDVIIMVGNIANPETYRFYAENNCVDYIRIGIGNGNGCLTTKQSGVGFPMASLIHETYKVKEDMISSHAIVHKIHDNLIGNTYVINKYPKIVADGGMKDYSDIIKALALGADYVMVGSIFNKSLESCADNYFHGIKINKKIAKYLFTKGFSVKKYFRGMSTKEAQKAMGKNMFRTSEGVVRYRNVEYTLIGWISNFTHYLRNAMSYSDARTLDEFIGNVNIINITQKSYDRYNK